MREYPELKKEDIVVDPEFFCVEGYGKEGVAFYLETWFDVDAYFGTKTRDTDICLNLYATVSPNGLFVSGHYILIIPGEADVCENWNFNENEQKMILEMCQAVVQREEGMTIEEFFKEYGPDLSWEDKRKIYDEVNLILRTEDINNVIDELVAVEDITEEESNLFTDEIRKELAGLFINKHDCDLADADQMKELVKNCLEELRKETGNG